MTPETRLSGRMHKVCYVIASWVIRENTMFNVTTIRQGEKVSQVMNEDSLRVFLSTLDLRTLVGLSVEQVSTSDTIDWTPEEILAREG